MMLVSLTTMQGRRLRRPDHHGRGRYEDLIARPGQDVDTELWGISDQEAADLIRIGAARSKFVEAR